MPTVTASKIAEKGITLDREVKFLVNKARIAKRKADDEAAAKAAKDKADAKKKKKAEKAANDTEEADGRHLIDNCIVLLLETKRISVDPELSMSSQVPNVK